MLETYCLGVSNLFSLSSIDVKGEPVLSLRYSFQSYRPPRSDRQHKDIRICPLPVKPIKAFYGPALPGGILGNKALWPQIDRIGQAFYFFVSGLDKSDS
jgi:hypothetical protein